MPTLPALTNSNEEEIFAQRILFHGIALLLWERRADMVGWPSRVKQRIQAEALLQTFWEASHMGAISKLIEALHEQSINIALMKGTALAYSLYAKPAVRRRGDTDIVTWTGSRKAIRAVLIQCGFQPTSHQRGLQESWTFDAHDGFTHEVDIHWRLSSSPTIANALDTIKAGTVLQNLPGLAPHAKSFSALHNLIMICLNRAAHGAFGYYVEQDRRKENGRLIWAIDIKLLSESLQLNEWKQLIVLAQLSSTADVVRDGLLFAQQALGTTIPDDVLDQLAQIPGPHLVSSYLAESSSVGRMRLDWLASHGLYDRLNLIGRHALPDKLLLLERYPNARNWPLAILYARRVLESGLKWLRG